VPAKVTWEISRIFQWVKSIILETRISAGVERLCDAYYTEVFVTMSLLYAQDRMLKLVLSWALAAISSMG